MLTADPNEARDQKYILKEEKYNSTNFLTLWDFEGILKYSPIFYGWYTNSESNKRGYRLPFAYFVTGLVVYAYSFFAILRKMAENSRMSKLSEKDDECIFSWKLFTAWDYMIGNAETAHNRVASIVMGFKEALLEEAEKKRESRNWKVICFRLLVNSIVLGLLSFSVFAVVMVVKRSTELDANSTVWRRNETTVVMSLISLFFPMVFEILGFLEQYHPRKQLRLQLARIMVLNLLNLYSLIFALFDKINDMTEELEEFKNITNTSHSTAHSVTDRYDLTPLPTTKSCYYACLDDNNAAVLQSANLIEELTQNISMFALPKISQILSALDLDWISNINSTNITLYDLYNSSVSDNSSSINITDVIFANETINAYFLNETTGNYTELNYADFSELFQDYLNYILYSFKANVTDFDFTNSSQTSIINNISNINYPNSSTTENWESILSTLIPFLNSTDGVKEKINTDLSTLFDNISSTISSLQENITDTSCRRICDEVPNLNQTLTSLTTMSSSIATLNYTTRARLRTLCWETMFGQELIKLTVMDLIMTVLSTLAIDLFRGIFVRVMNRCWCWDLEKNFPQYGDFKVAENILHLVNNQGMVWMGMFFSPGLVVFNVAKLYLMMYFRAWAVLTCNVPHEIIFRASRSNNFYYALLLMMLFLCVLPVGYAIVWVNPSWHCGPFSKYGRIFHIFTETIKNNVHEKLYKMFDYMASPGIIIPLLVLLILIIYYLISLTGALREANDDLKIQLRRERTEERRKMFQIADRRRRGDSTEFNEFANTPFGKWKKLLNSLPSGKSFDETPKQGSEDLPPSIKEEKAENRSSDFFSKFIKRALRKPSVSDGDQNEEDGTDTELHDSLPDDSVISKQLQRKIRPSSLRSHSRFQIAVNRSLSLRRSQGNIESLPTENTDLSDTKNDNKSDVKRHPPLHRCDTFDKNKNSDNRRDYEGKPSTSADMRQDSGSSVWSDNIPVIKISKTESAENILEDNITKLQHSSEAENRRHDLVKTEQTKFKPRIKCALTKQSTEFDADLICHFGKQIEKNIADNKILLEDTEHLSRTSSLDKISNLTELSKIENSEDLLTENTSSDELKDTSVDTVLNSPYINRASPENTD